MSYQQHIYKFSTTVNGKPFEGTFIEWDYAVEQAIGETIWLGGDVYISLVPEMITIVDRMDASPYKFNPIGRIFRACRVCGRVIYQNEEWDDMEGYTYNENAWDEAKMCDPCLTKMKEQAEQDLNEMMLEPPIKVRM